MTSEKIKRTLVSTLGVLARKKPSQMIVHADNIIASVCPLLVVDPMDQEDTEYYDLIEACIQVLEALVETCGPRGRVQEVALEFLTVYEISHP